MLLQWLHVVAAAVALGANATYGLWFARSRAAPESLAFTLRTVKFLDDRIANPSYGAVAVTGALMIWIGPYKFTTPWVLASIVLFLVVAGLASAVFTPDLRRQIALLDAAGAGSAEYGALARRGRTVGGILAVLVLAIFYLMVAQPTLWG